MGLLYLYLLSFHINNDASGAYYLRVTHLMQTVDKPNVLADGLRL